MTETGAPRPRPWVDAGIAAASIAVDPHGLGGAVVRALPGPVRDRWLELLRSLLPPDLPVRRLPAHVTDDRLLGGLDLAATLQAGRPVSERGLLADADGGLVLVAMAERASPSTVTHLGAALDRGLVLLERDGLALRLPATVGILALDEGVSDEEACAPALTDRLAFDVDLHWLVRGDTITLDLDATTIARARERYGRVVMGEAVVEALAGASLALGIASVHAPLLALKAARAAAALDGRLEVDAEDAALAARLVLAPRATRLPPIEPEPAPEEEPFEPPPEEGDAGERQEPTPEEVERLQGLVLQAAAAAIPDDLLAPLRIESLRRAGGSSGTAGALRTSKLRGRPLGARPGLPRSGARLNLVETLRAAGPTVVPLTGANIDPALHARIVAGEVPELEDPPCPRSTS